MSDSDRIKIFCRDVSYNEENLFIRRLRSSGLSDEQIVIVISAIENTCNACWDNISGCKCWNDN